MPISVTTKYLSKKALNLTDAEKTQTFENFVKGRSRQDLTETCLGHLRPTPILVFFDNFVRFKMASREPCSDDFSAWSCWILGSETRFGNDVRFWWDVWNTKT
jgi:hypothetical protein